MLRAVIQQVSDISMTSRRIPVVAIVLLLIAASRLIWLDDLTMNTDEIWSAWQTFGTPQQIIQWTPYDWPPGYYLLLAGWRSLTSAYPLALRTLSALLFLIGTTFVFRLMRRWQGVEAGILGMLAYGALGYGLLLSLEVRGYALMLALLPLALWLTVRYFDRPSVRRAVPLALALAAMFYTSLTSFGAFMMFGLLTLIVYGRAIWRWWLPGILAAALVLPEILAKAQIATARVEATQTLNLPPLPEALLQLFQDYTGLSFYLWLALFVIAGAWVLYRRVANRLLIALFVWGVVVPVVLYGLNPVLGFFSPRYAWWVMPGLALFVASGLAYLPHYGRTAASLVLAVMLFFPLRTDGQYQIWDQLSPLGENFGWLRDHMRPGDSLLGNTDNACGTPEEWDYYQRVYFPAGLHAVTSPAGIRRLWVLNADDQPNPVKSELQTGYVAGRFVGPPGCLFRLYEAPPDSTGVLFDNGMRFHGVDVLNGDNVLDGSVVRHEGETVRLRLWWSVDRVPELDYSVSTYLVRGQTVYDQIDSPPQPDEPPSAPTETSRWQPGTYYVETRELALPFPAANQYDIRMTVYFWADPVPIPAPEVDENGHLRLLRVTVKSY
ncbi:MAG: hypothetical protein CL610_17275 [Anaerolineaceae bacterium]|nr:hypothetical protein [Anaerolineaceae bacterium]